MARSMSAFLLVQVPSENQLRLHPGTELQLSAKAQHVRDSQTSLDHFRSYCVYVVQHNIKHSDTVWKNMFPDDSSILFCKL